MNTIADSPQSFKRKLGGQPIPLNSNLTLASEGFNVTFEKRFWSKVRKTETCWFWTGAPDRAGYGVISRGGKIASKILASRASWILHFGVVKNGFEVCHSCDVNYPPGDIMYRLCVRPDHLHLATHEDNMREIAKKGRAGVVNGERNGKSKLTNEQVLEIRQRYVRNSHDHGLLAIAKDLGVSHQTIIRVVKHQGWNHI